VAEHQITIGDEEIRQFYLANLPLWIKPESVRFSLIEVATEQEAIAARARVMAGEAFADVAREVSTHAPTKAYGGDIGGLVPKGYSTGERAAIEDTAFSLGINEVSQPLQVESKWYLVMPTEKTAYQEPTLQEMHDNIHAIMLNQEVDPYLEEWRKNLWDKASIEIKYPIYQNIAATDFTPGGSGSFIAPVIAVVNGKSIPEGAFFFHLLREHGRETVLSQIETIILNQQAPEMDVEATTEEARSMLQSIYDAGKLAVLDTAFTPDILDRTMVREMSALGVKRKKTQEIVQEQGIEITDDQVMQYYLDNLPRWSRPDMVRFSMIVTASQADAAAARQRIVNGESFETVCRAVSTNEPTRAYGGDVGYINKGYATGDSKIIEDTAFNLEVGGVSQPFQVGSNWFIIKLTDKQAAYEPTFPEKHDEIYTRLLQDRVAPFLFGWRRDLWNAASIRVVYPIYADNPSPAFSEQPAPTTGE
jgi:parvulin-like peptidyl-prolyl isomerase